MPFRWRLTAALGVLALLGGCMPLSPDDPTVDPAVTATAVGIAPTAPVTGGVLDVNDFKSRVVSAVKSAPTGTFSIVISTTLASGDLTLRYNGSYDVTDPQMPRCRLDGGQNGQPLQIITVGDKLYTKAGTGKYVQSSVSVSVARLGLATVRPDLPTLAGLLATSVVALTDVGPDIIDGLSVEHWRAVVDASVFAPTASGTTPVDIWLDSADLPRQVSYSLTANGSGATTVAITYDDFNSAVGISEPSRSELR